MTCFFITWEVQPGKFCISCLFVSHLHANLFEDSVPTLAGVYPGVADDVSIQREHLRVRHGCWEMENEEGLRQTARKKVRRKKSGPTRELAGVQMQESTAPPIFLVHLFCEEAFFWQPRRTGVDRTNAATRGVEEVGFGLLIKLL